LAGQVGRQAVSSVSAPPTRTRPAVCLVSVSVSVLYRRYPRLLRAANFFTLTGKEGSCPPIPARIVVPHKIYFSLVHSQHSLLLVLSWRSGTCTSYLIDHSNSTVPYLSYLPDE
jgi:hypothetical protein